MGLVAPVKKSFRRLVFQSGSTDGLHDPIF